MATSGARYYSVSVSELGRFATFQGGEPTITIGQAWNGGAKVPDRTQSRKTYGNITVSRPFSPTRDRTWIRRLNAWIGTAKTFTIGKADLDANDVVINKADTWVNCLVVRVGEPAYSEDDSSPSMWEIEFAVGTRS
jgi:hypothetical protein